MTQDMTFSANMNILPGETSNLYAVGTVTIDGLFVIRDVKVIYLDKEGFDEKQLTVCLPRHYNKKTESWDCVVQLTKEQRKEMEKAIVMDLNGKFGSSIHDPGEYCDIKINLCSPSMAPTLGYAEVHYRDILCLKKVRITQGSDGKIQIFPPANRNKDGSYSSLFGMVTSELQRSLEDVIREKFKEVYQLLNGREYQENTGMKYLETEDGGEPAQDENVHCHESVQSHSGRAGR